MKRQFLFPVPGEYLRDILDKKVERGEQFTLEDAIIDVMLDRDKVALRRMAKMHSVRHYASRWKWSATEVHRGLAGDAARAQPAYLVEEATEWRTFYAKTPVPDPIGSGIAQTPSHMPSHAGTLRERSGNTPGTTSGQENTWKATPGNTPGTLREHPGNEKRDRKRQKKTEKQEGTVPGGTPPSRFEEFWRAYPIKRARKPAEASWKAKKLDARADFIIADVENRKARDGQWQRGFIPLPSTYLGQERWNDDTNEIRSPEPGRNPGKFPNASQPAGFKPRPPGAPGLSRYDDITG